ncbi:MAG: hypothetical protein AB7O96_14330 [Pseudobdellovibrionaceae bacterium]
MRKVGDIMKELGFTKDSPKATQEAFIRHLIKAAYGVDVRTPSQELKLVTQENLEKEKPKIKEETPSAPVQLSFDLESVS